MCFACTEGPSGQHFRDFVNGDIEQDLAGFEDEVDDDQQNAPPGTTEELVGDEEAKEDDDDAAAERILQEATSYGVDELRELRRPAAPRADAGRAAADAGGAAADEPEELVEAGAATAREHSA